MKLREIKAPAYPAEPEMTNIRAYVTDNGLTILYSEDITRWGSLKHISISHPKRLPFWHDVVEIKEKLMGDLDCMMVLPKK